MMETNHPKKNSPTLGAPKNFLIPIMLLHLRDWNAHGYELIEKLTKFGIDSLDHGNFYRTLRQLEKDSLVTSVWDTTSGGPAKRIYSITEAGEQYLDMWAGSLGEYQKMLNSFFNLYNPFNYSFSPTPKKSRVVKEEPTTPVEAETEETLETVSTEDSLPEAVTENTVLTEKPIIEEKAVIEEKPALEDQTKTAVSKPAAKKPTTRRTTKPKTPKTTKPTAKASTNAQTSNKE